MSGKELKEIIKKAAPICLPSSTKEEHIDMLVRYLVANGVTVQEWISVEDRLPKQGVRVLVAKEFLGRPYIDIGEMVGEQLCCASDEYCIKPWLHIFTHWMPMPEPPKGE